MDLPVLVEEVGERSALEVVAGEEHDLGMEAVVSRSVPVVEVVEQLVVAGQVVVALVEGETEVVGVVVGRVTCEVALSKDHRHHRALQSVALGLEALAAVGGSEVGEDDPEVVVGGHF